MNALRIIENHLLGLVLVTAGLGLAFPAAGESLQDGVAPLLALLMFFISLTFDARAVLDAARRPVPQILSLLLVYGPMPLAALFIGRVVWGSGPLADGMTLVGTLPTDVSAPLLVLMARGNVAFAAVMNATNTALSPFVVPALFLLLAGVQLETPVGDLILALLVTVLVPIIAGSALRTCFRDSVARFDPAYSAGSSVVYLLLLLAVIGPNATTILDYGWDAAVIAGATLALNVSGYGFAAIARLWTTTRPDRIAYLFTVSKKEFSIAAVVIAASGLPPEMAVPAVFYAVIQMVTSPIAVRLLTARSGTDASQEVP